MDGRVVSFSSSDTDPPGQRMSAGEAVLICCSLLSLVVSCILWSSRKQEWVDEIYTWTEVNDRSLWHLYYAIQHGADGGMPLFYTTAWAWAKIFGGGTLALRLYSCLTICGAVVVVWRTLRRAYGVGSTAFGTLMVFGTSVLVLDQNAEARFYGLYTLTVAIVIAFYARLAEQENPTRKLLAGAMLAQAALVLSHVFGILYGALVLLALILFDAGKRRFRVRVYLFQAAGWLALLIWLPAILASIAAGKPHGWIPMPVIRDVLTSYNFDMWLNPILLLQTHASLAESHYESLLVLAVQDSLLLMVAAAILTALVRLWHDLTADRSKRELGKREFERISLMMVTLSILTVPLILVMLSHLVTPVYVPRYALPSAVGMAFILAGFADALGLDRIRKLPSVAGLAWAIVLVILVSMPVISALILDSSSASPEYLDVAQLDATVPANVPVVVGWQHDFFKAMRYSKRRDPYVFLLDWTTALKGDAEFVPDFHLMSSYRQAGYYSDNIRDQTDFLCRHSYFLVLDNPDMSWLDVVGKEVPGLQREVIATIDDDRTLFSVRRTGSYAGCDAR